MWPSRQPIDHVPEEVCAWACCSRHGQRSPSSRPLTKLSCEPDDRMTWPGVHKGHGLEDT